MEQPSSSSKVTIEYFDPHEVYQLLAPGLLPRLPLRDLHWSSHAGPLRSISSLHVDLIPSTVQLSPLSTTDLAFANSPSLSRVKSEDSTGSGDDGFRTQALGQAAVERPVSQAGAPKSAVQKRRHQIPGLRQTPYLRVFFLRCDDNDVYKNQARRQVREWIQEHTRPSHSTTKLNAPENHDAFEWLIVHVIVPNTAAATQPRTGLKGSDGSTGSATSKTWRGGTSTILDKLRADFNGSSKSSVDRVAQIRIGVNDVPYDMLPRVVPAIPGSYSETPQENDAAWQDLVGKFKSLILSSFDMRVSQYEEDIREKDAQRTLPGWNFCTFFMLKEGLARGFESVGLVEDALVGYDELAIGLDAIIRDQGSTGAGAAQAGAFLPYTEDLKRTVDRAIAATLKEIGNEDEDESEEPIDLQSSGTNHDTEVDEIPLNTIKKRYRDLIMANNISIFDFRCYLFARQLSLLLRLANAWSSQEELLAKLKEQRESSLQGVAARLPASQPSDDAENLIVLGEVCKRSIDFVASISRIMRDDFWASHSAIQQPDADGTANADLKTDPIMVRILDNVVSSFTFSVVQQILAQTSTKSLPIPPSTLAPPSGTIGIDGQEQKAAIPEPKTMMHPARSSSLAIRSPSRDPPSPGLLPGGRRASVPDRGSVSSTFLKPGLEDLAAQRAELYLLSRNMLEKVGRGRGWSVGWDEVANFHLSSAADMEEVDLDEQSSEKSKILDMPIKTASSLQGVDSRLLRVALENKDDYYRLYEMLTDKALRHYTVASHVQSVHTSMADLAVLKYHLADYAAAASYFYRMTPFYGESGWTQIEISMLALYSKSLRQLDRREEYVRVVLKLLSKVTMAEKERISCKSSFKIARTQSLDHEEVLFPIEPHLSELLQMAKTLQHEIAASLRNFLGHLEVDGTPRYHPEKDSVSLQLRLQYLLSEDLNIDKAKVKMTPVSGENGREVWLETDGPVVLSKGSVELLVHTNVIIPGPYLVSHVSLYASNVVLKYDHESTGQPFPKEHTFFKCPKLLIFHQADAFDVKLFASKYMHLDRNRSLEIELSSGWNEVQSGELHIRAATAGLRLQTSEANVVSGSLEISNKSEASIIRFGVMNASSSSKIRIPFNLEHEVSDISLKLEISYKTDKGDFFFATTPHMSIMLPLGVNVQDVFKHQTLFSRFTISSATNSPLRLLSSKLENSELFEANCGLSLTRPVVIFPRQPASMLYKISKSPPPATNNQPASKKATSAPLSLVLYYVCLEEEIDNTITRALELALKESSLYQYIRLVASTVVAELRVRMSLYDLERIAILSEISSSILSSVQWRDHFNGLGKTIKTKEDIATLITDELQEWQRTNPIIPLIPVAMDEATIAQSRSIVIPVEVPSVTVVYTADLKFGESALISTNPAVVASNQPISALLRIKWTRIWDTQPESDVSGRPDHLEFVYEVSGASDTWLIGGRRRGHFKVPSASQPHQQKQDVSFPVMLIPLREGFLPYPNVEIKPAPTPKVIRAGSSGGQDVGNQAKQGTVNCETDYKNSGETIRVISDATKTTVSLDASGPQGGAWLLETERRPGNSQVVLG